MSSDSTHVDFADSDTRDDEMHRTINQWLDDLTGLVDEATASEEFTAWLDVRWIAVDIVVVVTVHVRECPWWQRQVGHTAVG